jgi:hypothetical protein
MWSLSALNIAIALTCVGKIVTCTPGAAAGNIEARATTPELPYDPNSTKYCTFWWDTEGSYTCQNIVDAWGLSMTDFIRWVCLFCVALPRATLYLAGTN